MSAGGGVAVGGCCILLFSPVSFPAPTACTTGPCPTAHPRRYPLPWPPPVRPAHACRTPPDNDIARGPGFDRGFRGWRCPAGCEGVAFCLVLQRHRPEGRVSTASLPPTLLRCLEKPGPPRDWVSRHVPLAGILRRRRPPGKSFSCKGFRSIPAPRTSSTPPRTFNVTLVTNFVTPRPTHGPSAPERTTRGPVHNRHPIASREPLAGGAHGAPLVQTTGYACSWVRRAHHGFPPTWSRGSALPVSRIAGAGWS